MGGVKDYGKFNEGYCFRVSTKIPTKHFIQTKENLEPKRTEYITEKWVICTDTSNDKNKLMETLIKLKLENQDEKEIHIEYSKLDRNINNRSNINNLLLKREEKSEDIYERGKNPNDCYMRIIQSWTPCTLACGGGKSYLQLIKVEARDGGEDCKTKETILTKNCNTQHCPSLYQLKNLNLENKNNQSVDDTQNAIIKIMPISKRPQRYDKCHFKETDSLIEKKDETSKYLKNNPLIPVRLVMNEKTITAYLDDDLKNIVVTFLLDRSIFIKKDDNICFIIEDSSKSEKFCLLDRTRGNFVEEWFYDFNLFKYQCKKDREKSSILLTEEKKLENEFKKKIENIKIELIQEKADIIKKKVGEIEKVNLINQIKEVRKISLNAIKKEMKLEDLLQKEEESREENESNMLENQILLEKKKEKFLLRSIKEKEIENQYNIAKAKAEQAIEQIKKNTQIQIANQRQTIAKKIIEMRKKQNRKKAELNNEIMNIRSNIAEKLKKINKIGNEVSCRDRKNKENYCNNNFSENYLKYQDCMNDSFCYVCCENEFGDLHVLERDNCYSKCESVKSED